ncbi:MAG: hypothetical protein ABIR56_01090 [Polaromonas sp.]
MGHTPTDNPPWPRNQRNGHYRRCHAERDAAKLMVSESPTEVIVALGREGKKQVDIDAGKLPHTAAMATKLQGYVTVKCGNLRTHGKPLLLAVDDMGVC